VAANDRLENRAVENRARPGGARRSIPGSIPWPLPWPGGGQGARWSTDWWRAQFGSPARIREWAAQAVPVAVCALGAVLLHRQIVPQKIVLNVIALGLFAIALGFAVATLKTSLIQHPVLRFPASGVTVSGFVELREESQHTDRFVRRVDCIDGGRIEEPPRRVRLSVKRGMAPAPGSFVEVKASLEPRLQPLANPAVTISRAICFSRASARPALSAAR
jgi:competence protein ComEC